MAVLVDTNVIIDVLTDDPSWAEWSTAQLQDHSDEGLIINPVIYAELCFGSPSAEFVDGVIRTFGLIFQEIPRQGLFRAANAFARYRARRGTKVSPLPDFFIGGHADASSLAVITRDTQRMSSYFPRVRLITP